MVVLMWLVGFFVGTLLPFINKWAILALKVTMDIDHKSEMEDILNLYQEKWNVMQISEHQSDKEVKFI